MSVAARVALVALAAWALHRELAGLDAGALLPALGSYGAPRLALGLAATALSFALLGALEVMALRYAGRADVPWRTGAVTGFVAGALSQAVGVSLLTGAAVRHRAYRRYALGAPDVARVTAFVTGSVTLGLLATGAVAFLSSTTPLRILGRAISVHLMGALLALVVLAWLGWSVRGARAVIGRGRWRMERPRPRLAAAQTALASLDWIVTGSLLFLVLPAGARVGYLTSLRVYLVAQTAGMLSHVPGGAGVFELLVLALLAPAIDPAWRAAVVASLVIYRVLYYLVPLAAACVVTGVAEARAPRLMATAHER